MNVCVDVGIMQKLVLYLHIGLVFDLVMYIDGGCVP
jgi:hypothetical protein